MLISVLMHHLPLAGFGFALIGGLGFGLVLDHRDRNPNKRLFGFILGVASVILGVLCLLFGLN